MKSYTVGLLGNPNAGKTTLFNQLTGAHQRTGNWAGVTVERKEGVFKTAQSRVTLVDLPGTYSLTTLSAHASPDEQIACHYLFSRQADLFINVVDASSLERNLYLTLQLLELGVPCIVALNMLDIAHSRNIAIDVAALAHQLGCPVIPLVSTTGKGLDALKQAIDQPPVHTQPPRVDYGQDIEQHLARLLTFFPKTESTVRARWLCLQRLEGDIWSMAQVPAAANAWLTTFTPDKHSALAVKIVDARYRTLSALCRHVCTKRAAKPHRLTQRLDSIALNRWLGLPLFLGIMYLMFVLAINVGGALQPLFDAGSVAIFIHGTLWLGATLHLPQWLTLFLAQGIGGGINTVLPLIPQIGIMYLCLSFLEDSGYMARAAFVMDRLMQALGLPGKSFVPLIVGFGCNVPAVMGARTLDAARERLITIMMAPFMSCGARLAIFAVFAAAFFGQHGALVIFALYVTGIVVAVLTGLLLKHTLLRGDATPFVMELPLYHVPHLKSLLLQTWQRLQGFVLRAGKIIIIVSIFIGTLNSFTLQGKPTHSIDASALASISRQVTPLLTPIGIAPDHWQATVGLITGAMAKEVVVGTLNSLYTAQSLQEAPFNPATFSLTGELRDAVSETWHALLETFSWQTFSNPVEASKGDGEMSSGAMGMMSRKFGSDTAAFSYLLFVLLYVPCVSVMGAIARESQRRWMLFSIAWGLDMAWSLATLFYQTVSFQRHPQSSAVYILLILFVNAVLFALLRKVKIQPQTLIFMTNSSPCNGCSRQKQCH